MNEAQKILRKEINTIQYCISSIEIDIELKNEALKNHKERLKEILDALLCLESVK